MFKTQYPFEQHNHTPKKNTHPLIKIFLCVLIIIVLRSFKDLTESTIMQDKDKKDNPYETMREMALETKPEQLGLSFLSTQTVVYGIVMDWDVKNGKASIISFMTGDASIYFSSGGGIIGGGTHERVSLVSKELVTNAQLFLDKAKKTDLTPLPEKENVIFYFITNKGIFFGQDKLENMSNQSSIWLSLFLTGNELITELRKIKEK